MREHPLLDETMVGVSEDYAECSNGCWEGDVRNLQPDFDDCYRCPCSRCPLLFACDGDIRLIDDELPDLPIVAYAK